MPAVTFAQVVPINRITNGLVKRAQSITLQHLMNNKGKIFSVLQQASSIFMIVVLLWLTISTPFAFACQQKLAEQGKIENSNSPAPGNEEEASNPFSGTTEEKNPGSTSFSEEYLHIQHVTDHFIFNSTQYHNCENADTYHAFHGELLVPPPNIA